MPIKVYHPDHGFVLTNDQTEIDALVAKGGQIVVKCKEAFANEEVKETPKDEVLNDGGICVTTNPPKYIPNKRR